MSRVLLVGESNPYGRDPRFALWPSPPNSVGARLARILGVTSREYLRTFDRVNLLEVGRAAPWSLAAARRAALALRHPVRVLLGARVAAAHDVEFAPFSVVEGRPGCGWDRLLILPHPSGRSRFWNAPEARLRARVALAALRRGH